MQLLYFRARRPPPAGKFQPPRSYSRSFGTWTATRRPHARRCSLSAQTLIALCAVLTFAPLALAQVTNVDNTTSTPIPGVGHDYVHLLSETVNPANGSVSLRIQVPTPAGRGISLPFSFSYDSSGVRDLVPAAPGSASWVANTGYFTQGGWSYALPLAYSHHWTVTTQSGGIYQSCFYISNYVFRDSSGSMHSLGVGAMYGNSN